MGVHDKLWHEPHAVRAELWRCLQIGIALNQQSGVILSTAGIFSYPPNRFRQAVSRFQHPYYNMEQRAPVKKAYAFMIAFVGLSPKYLKKKQLHLIALDSSIGLKKKQLHLPATSG